MGHVMGLINRRPNRLAIDALGAGGRDVVLELGCGPGAALQLLHQSAPLAQIHGLDQSPVMLDQAARRNPAAIRAGALTLHRGDFAHLPLAGASVDRILAVNVAYFWFDALPVLAEMNRVLRPGGRIVIYATDASAMRRWKFAGRDTHRLFDAGSLAATLRSGPFPSPAIVVRQVSAGFGIAGLLAVIDVPATSDQPSSRQQAESTS